MIPYLVAIAAGLDIGTGLYLGPGQEANPVVVSLGYAAIALKLALVVWLAAYVWSKTRYSRLVASFGIATWTFGAWTNVLTVRP